MRPSLFVFATLVLLGFGCASPEPDHSLSVQPKLDPNLGWEVMLRDPIFIAFNRHPEREPGGIGREVPAQSGEFGPERYAILVQGKPHNDWLARYESFELTFSGILATITVDALGVAMKCRQTYYDEIIPDGREVRLLAIRGITKNKVAEAIYPR